MQCAHIFQLSLLFFHFHFFDPTRRIFVCLNVCVTMAALEKKGVHDPIIMLQNHQQAAHIVDYF